MILRRHRPWLLLGVLALAVATALVWSDAALAQQSEPPTELWQEYPLDPERGSPEPGSGSPQGQDSRGDRAPAGDDGGAAGAGGEGRFPLLPILLALGVVLLVLILGVGIWVHAPGGLRNRIGAVRLPSLLDRSRPVHAALRLSRGFRLRDRIGAVRLPSLLDRSRPVHVALRLSRGFRLRDRIGAVRLPSLLDRSRPVHAALGLRRGFLDHGPGPGYPPRPPAELEEELKLRTKSASGPAKSRKPKAGAPARKKRLGQKPQAAKPRQAAKRTKPVRPAKPGRPAAQGASQAPKKPVSAPRPRPKPRTRKKAPAKKAAERGQPRLVVADTLAEPTLTCSIFGWRDGPLADFYALASGLQGHEWVVERSPKFEWPAGDFPPEGRVAHALLVEALVQDGWRPVGSEGVWYRQRFERPIEGG